MKTLDRQTRFRVLHEAGFRCCYCGRGAPDVVLEVDHVRPRAHGGTNARENLVAACFDCNRGKRTTVLVRTDQWSSIPDALQACGDACWQCPTIGVTTLPVAMRREPTGWVAMLYRCQNGHEWPTWYAPGVAEYMSAGTLEEDLECWPPLAPLRSRLREAEVARLKGKR